MDGVGMVRHSYEFFNRESFPTTESINQTHKRKVHDEIIVIIRDGSRIVVASSLHTLP
jgi:hypothetical protein